jgi:hypothetical protein
MGIQSPFRRLIASGVAEAGSVRNSCAAQRESPTSGWAALYFAIVAINRNDPRCWLWFGVVAGLGLEEKYSIAVFGRHGRRPTVD